MQLRVKVQPKASRIAIRVEADGTFRISLTAPPVDGKANEALCAYVSKTLNIARRHVSVERGQQSRLKTIRVETLEETEVLARLDSAAKS